MLITVKSRLSLRNVSHQGYTRLVRRLRIILPVAAVLVIAGVVIWPHFDPAQAPKRHAQAAAPEMNHSHFSGIDKRNRPYTITADKAVQKSSSSNDVDLVNPVAEITLQGGSWIALRADQGQYREDPGQIALEGNVQLFHDKGYEVATSAAVIDLDQGIAWSNQPTHGHGPRGDIQGEGFRLIQDSDRIIFTGNSRLLLRPDADEIAPDGSVIDDDQSGMSDSPPGAAP